MKSMQDMSYHFACQKAYRGQIKCPHVVYVRDNGMWGAMPYGMYKMLKVGTPRYYVHHTSHGMGVAGWEFRRKYGG